ncbi:MAG: glycosyltransferase [Desulfobacteraceae bacterium]|nr:MAG: glycosyltransferase [Desulfobacteraceae bacterium]
MIAPTPFYSGRGTHMRILHEANALAERGHRIIIVTYHNGTTPDNLHPNISIRRIIRFLFWYTQIAPGPNWQKIFLDMLLCIKTLRISKKEKPAILHGHLHEGILIGWVVKKLLFFRKLILVGDFHGPLVEEMRSHGYLRIGLIQKIFNFIEKIIHRMPNQVFVSSPGLKQKINGDRKENDAFVLTDAPTLTYKSNPPANLVHNRHESDLPSVVYTGGFTPDKGLEQLFEVIAYSIKNGLLCHWIIAGDPLKQLIVPEEIKTALTVISPLGYERLSELLQRADVACDPKRGNILQGSGKLLNYMYAGLPTVCFDGPAQRFYLGDELAAIFIARDTEDFYHILKTLLAMPADEKRKLKAKILKRVNEFSWAQSARMLENHYAEQLELK